MANVLLVATNYDTNTRVTHSWAVELAARLRTLGHQLKMIDGGRVDAGAVKAAIQESDILIFFGHGEADQFLYSSSGKKVALIDARNVDAINGRLTYAVCCRALLGLGSAYAQAFPSGTFIGYGAPFVVPRRPDNAEEFGHIVNVGAEEFVEGRRADVVVNGLRARWFALADDFLNGDRSARGDAFLAGLAANANGRYIGALPTA